MTRIPGLARDERGVTVIEFSILAPVLIFLIMGAIELVHMAMVKSTLEGSIQAAARQATADLNTTDDNRDVKLRAYITERMDAYPRPAGRNIDIQTQVFHTFGSAYPESFEDDNENGVWDAASGTEPAERFDDRNRNGVQDMAVQVAGKLGGPGDVVVYTASYPAAFYFEAFKGWFGMPNGFTVSAKVVMRNEPVARPTGGAG